MANFGPKDIKKLREITDAGMMDCKKALTAAEGNIDKAIEWLRDQGIGAAAKKASKTAAEGAIGIKVEESKAVIVEINSQTDFVAQNDKFKALMSEVVEHAFNNSLEDAEAINASTINGQPFSEFLAQNIAIIGENLVVRRAALIKGDEKTAISGYVHSNGQNGVIIAATCEDTQTCEKVTPILREIAMHAAAMAPKTLTYKDFDPEYVLEETKGRIEAIRKENEELERLGKPLKNIPQYISRMQLTEEVIVAAEEVIKAELKAEGKPEKIWDKILPGKLERFISDNTTLDQEQCLLDQKFVMDDSKTVSEYFEEKSDGKAKIIVFTRLEVGEGIEIEEEDFAAEVAKQMGA
ncbi:MAG: translation elongation factor Ts [Sulfurovum sp.]|nr:translation elongation factor Ts [Sulfurovum sp.]MCB4745028.1 translation elongation factor Ts [Sulfurovum sp.]MCB4746681.1 translation elongation factor Ts [Sulfurovum sp.]MCB4748034.1 translation elongation factor Ts [Sulfurovum sp.]MCB4748923.1 translation elongation factor Ts [Sulfurovum sp.]